MQTIQQQKGVATIVFVLIFPFFFGFFVLAVEGTRYLTDSARLSDVLESASLSVAAAVNHSDDKARVSAYIAATVPDADIDPSDITITAKSCKQVYGNQCGVAGVYDKNGLLFNEYNVQVDSSFASWFPGTDLIAGFSKQQTLVNNAVARKYQQEFVDIAFVIDLSGSMLDNFGGEHKAKYAGVIDIITEIMDTVDSYNRLAQRSNNNGRNRVAVVPYSEFNKTIYNNTLIDRSYSYNSGGWGSPREVNGPRTRDSISPSYSLADFQAKGINLHTEYPNGVPTLDDAVPDKQAIQRYFGWERGRQYRVCNWGCYYRYAWEYDDWNYQTDDNWWNWSHVQERDNNIKIRNYIGCSNYSSNTDWRRNCTSIATSGSPGYTGYYYNIPLSDDFPGIEENIANFFPSGSTSSTQGVIPAAQLLLNKSTENNDNLIIVLSDGQDTDNGLSLGYYQAGLCDHLRQQFTDKGQTLKIAVIGFDYDTRQNPGLASCADTNNILSAQSYSDIYNSILSLITEEIGHLYDHKYSVE